MRYNINVFISNAGARNEVRYRVIEQFMKEVPGQGKGKLASRYNYNVECLKDGNKIILTRPANLKNGFDFLIRVENIDFSNEKGKHRDNPKHDDILDDLKLKKEENSNLYKKLYKYIELTYKCNEINEKWFENLNFDNGYPSDLIIKTFKWFFIEQDIRYWNYSGRDMLFSIVPMP